MRKYYSDEAWEAWKHHYEDWPPDEWRALYRDIIAAIGSDPKGPVAQALCDRWLSIVQGASPQPAVRTGLIKAWADREHWPAALKRRAAEYDIERATRFIGEALWERWEAERLERERAGTPAPPSRQRVEAHVVSRLRLDSGLRADESGSAVAGREVAGTRRGRNAGRRRAQAGRAGCALTPTRVAGWNEAIHRVAV